MRHLLVIASLALSACATTAPTVYAPAGTADRGYSEQQIEADRFRVSFAAGPDMSIQRAETLALRRAAELTLEHGADWFLVVHRERDGNDRDPVRMSGSFGQSFGSRGYRGRSVGLGLHFDGSAGEKRASLEILLRTGPRDAEHSEAYDAREVLRNLDFRD